MKKIETLKFIDNLDCNAKGYKGEKIVTDTIKDFFQDRTCIGMHGYLINIPSSKFTIEADILLLDREIGITVFEVKGIHIENILSIKADGWKCTKIYKSKIDPVYQVDRTTGNLLDYIKSNALISKNIGVKPAIVLPYITSYEWKRAGYHNYAFLPPIIFQDDLKEKEKFFLKLNMIPYKHRALQLMSDCEYKEAKNILFGGFKKENSSYKVPTEDEFLNSLL